MFFTTVLGDIKNDNLTSEIKPEVKIWPNSLSNILSFPNPDKT
jgi:hypothetical protein